MSNAIVLQRYIYVIITTDSSKTIWFELNVQLNVHRRRPSCFDLHRAPGVFWTQDASPGY